MSAKNQISDEDDDFFKPSASSSLAKIFGIPSTAPKLKEKLGNTASSFRYVPDVEKEENNVQLQNKPSEWSVVQAKVVTAYKLINHENILQGKVGIALLKLDDNLKIIIYRTKTDILSTINISEISKIYLKNEYFQFQSDNGEFWSILFENSLERDTLITLISSKCSIKQDEPSVEPLKIEVQEDEVDRSPEKTKASIISRMAKMGQPILVPQKPSISTTEVSDSSDTDSRIETIARPNIPHKRPSKNLVPFNPPSPMHIIPVSSSDASGLNIFLAENRIQNTETRMNLSKLESKLDRVLDRIDLLNLNAPNSGKIEGDRDEEILNLEEKILELKKENYMLKNRCKTIELEAGNNRKNKDEIGAKNKEIEELKEKLKEHSILSEVLQRDLNEKCEVLEDLNKQIINLKEKVGENEKIFVENASKSQEYDELLIKHNQLLEENALKSKEVLAEAPDPSSKIKEIMNNTYQKLAEQIDDPKILRVIGKTIKQETNNVLQQIK